MDNSVSTASEDESLGQTQHLFSPRGMADKAETDTLTKWLSKIVLNKSNIYF